MVVIGVVLGVSGVELLGELFVRMRLDREGLVDREDLEEERKLLAVPGDDGARQEGLVVLDELEQGAAGAYILGGVGRVGAHPELRSGQQVPDPAEYSCSNLSIGPVLLDAKVGRRGGGGKPGGGRAVALLAPVVGIDSALEP